MQTAAAGGDRVFDFLQEEELENESYKTKRLTNVRGEVEFEHVRFSYPDNPDKIIIKDFFGACGTWTESGYRRTYWRR